MDDFLDARPPIAEKTLPTLPELNMKLDSGKPLGEKDLSQYLFLSFSQNVVKEAREHEPVKKKNLNELVLKYQVPHEGTMKDKIDLCVKEHIEALREATSLAAKNGTKDEDSLRLHRRADAWRAMRVSLEEKMGTPENMGNINPNQSNVNILDETVVPAKKIA